MMRNLAALFVSRPVSLRGLALDMFPSPQANTLDQRQHRPAIVGQRILDGGRNRALRLSAHDPVAGKFA